jgi:hypothetical protein
MEKVLPLSLISTKGGIESLISLCCTLIEEQKKKAQSRFSEHPEGESGKDGWMPSQERNHRPGLQGSTGVLPTLFHNKSMVRLGVSVLGGNTASKLSTEQF